MQMPIDYDRNY